jgi:DNA-binding response OmpR family regulator
MTDATNSVIVLVEDDELLSEMYKARLEAEGYVCHAALDGAIGLQTIQQVNPDLVLLDLMLPQISGDQVLLQMRQDDRHKDTKVIIMTNISESESPDILSSLNFERYLVKANTALDQVIDIVRDTLHPLRPVPELA